MKDTNKERNNKNDSNNIPGYIGMESALGAACLLITKSKSHKYIFASDYEWMVIPPIMARQFVIFRNKKNEPVAFINFASVSDEVEKRLLDGGAKLTPKDWTSGDKLYIIDVVSPFAGVQEILKELNQNQFKNKNIKILRSNKKGMDGILLNDIVAEIDKNKDKMTKSE